MFEGKIAIRNDNRETSPRTFERSRTNTARQPQQACPDHHASLWHRWREHLAMASVWASVSAVKPKTRAVPGGRPTDAFTGGPRHNRPVRGNDDRDILHMLWGIVLGPHRARRVRLAPRATRAGMAAKAPALQLAAPGREACGGRETDQRAPRRRPPYPIVETTAITRPLAQTPRPLQTSPTGIPRTTRGPMPRRDQRDHGRRHQAHRHSALAIAPAA
jgi:hypothetical protein